MGQPLPEHDVLVNAADTIPTSQLTYPDNEASLATSPQSKNNTPSSVNPILSIDSQPQPILENAQPPRNTLQSNISANIAAQIHENIEGKSINIEPNTTTTHPIIILLLGIALFLTGMGITMLILLL